MADNEDDKKPPNDEQKIPPKLVIRPQTGGQPPADKEDAAQSKPAAEKPAPPAAQPPSAQPAGDGQTSPAEKKRDTSRLSVDDAVKQPGDTTPQTIRLKPAGGTAKVPKPGIVNQTPAADAKPVSEKRKTSRISLDAALAPEAPQSSDAPKTIRLKKPSEAATVRVGQSNAGKAAEPKKSDTAQVSAKPEASKTSQIAPQGPATQTRKRTIRVKRPTGKRGVQVDQDAGDGQPAAAARAAPAGAPQAGGAGEPVAVRDEPNWFFVFSSVAAVLVTCVIVYMFAAQAFGPNVSLTRLSYGAPELDLAWPGKLTGGR